MIAEVERGLDAKKMEKQIISHWKENDCAFQAKTAPHKKKQLVFFDAPLTTAKSKRSSELRKEILRDTLARFWSMNCFSPEPLSVFLPPLSVTFGSHALIEEEKKQMEQVGIWTCPDSVYTISSKKFMNVAWSTVKQLYEKNLLYPGKIISQVCPSCNEVSRQRENEQSKTTGVIVKLGFSDGNGSLAVFAANPKDFLDACGVSVSSRSRYVRFEFAGEQITAEESVAEFISKKTLKPLKKQEVLSKEIAGREVNNLVAGNSFGVDVLGGFKVVVQNPRDALQLNQGLKLVVPTASQKDYLIALENNLKIVQNVSKLESADKKRPAGKKIDLDSKVLSSLDKKQLLVEKVPSVVFSQDCLFCGSETKALLGSHWMLRAVDFNFELIKSLDSVEFEPDESRQKVKKNLMSTDFPISRVGGSGIPLPFWVCDRCGKLEIVGSVSELYEKSNKNNRFSDDFDSVTDSFCGLVRETTWSCGSCSNGKMKWVDQIFSRSFELAVTPFLPGRKDSEFQPADFVLANRIDKMHLLLLLPFALHRKPFFSRIYCTNYPDSENQSQLPASGKSADALRIASLSDKSLALDISLLDEPEEFISSLLKLHSNMVYFFSFEFQPEVYVVEHSEPEDLWLDSRLNSLSRDVADAYEKLDFKRVFFEIRNFVEKDLLEFFVPLSRKKLLIRDSKHPEKQAAFRSIYDALVQVAFLLAPMAPFVSEKIHLDLVYPSDNASTPTIHAKRWPGFAQMKINSEKEERMGLVKEIVSVAGVETGRGEKDLFVPFESAVIFSDVQKVEKAVTENKHILEFFLNAKDIEVKPLAGSVTKESVDFSKGKIKLVHSKTNEFEAEGKANKLIKEVGVLRSELGILPKEEIILEVAASKELVAELSGFEKNIKFMSFAKSLIFSEKIPALSSMSKKVVVFGQEVTITVAKK
ncbi:MAG: class I tRNA ligase family protein [Candidatus Diapherotrites archaeon]|nr:class I tRNA ligase family protein [Candidatus Diapherotrites archaeon]